MIELVNSFPEMMKTIINNFEAKKIGGFDKIFIAGMGGSAISGDIARNLFLQRTNIPIFVNRGYKIPMPFDDKSLLILISYSGNTAESLSVFSKAEKISQKIIIITSGGKLLQIAKAKDLPYYLVPGGIQPRAALPYLLTTVLLILDALNIADGIKSQISKCIKFLSSQMVPLSKLAKEISAKIGNKIPVILAVQGIAEAAGLRFKNQLNENSKTITIFEVAPELCHNFIEGLCAYKKNNLIDIIISDKDDTPRIKKTIDIIVKILKNKQNIIRIESAGRSDLDRMLYLIVLFDYVSVYLALLKKIDPTIIPAITDFKKEMEKKP